jgi:bifunctional ADP-heptose synthase (sugar kinase/adenylyltransferase)
MSGDFLSEAVLERILGRIPSLAVGVLGDLFLDRYLDIDASLTEPSLETGLDALQVVGVRSCPGAAGTVINNLVALGVRRVSAVAFRGEDGEGYELGRALEAMPAADLGGLCVTGQCRTPTYTKPLLHEPGRPPQELNRLDIKNRTLLPTEVEDTLLGALDRLWPACDAWVVLDQVSEPGCGVVTDRVQRRLEELARASLGRFVLVDSRERVGCFRLVSLKPNSRECLRAVSKGDTEAAQLEGAVAELSRRAAGTVFCTAGERGILVSPADGTARWVRAYPVAGPIDPVGAGDSASAALACASAAGASGVEAAAFANLVASITIRQLGTTGAASTEDVRRRWREVSA